MKHSFVVCKPAGVPRSFQPRQSVKTCLPSDMPVLCVSCPLGADVGGDGPAGGCVRRQELDNTDYHYSVFRYRSTRQTPTHLPSPQHTLRGGREGEGQVSPNLDTTILRARRRGIGQAAEVNGAVCTSGRRFWPCLMPQAPESSSVSLYSTLSRRRGVRKGRCIASFSWGDNSFARRHFSHHHHLHPL